MSIKVLRPLLALTTAIPVAKTSSSPLFVRFFQSTAFLKMSDTPMPQIFAIMRNGHEVIRGDAKDLQEKLEGGDVAAAKKIWEDMRKWETLHALMEDGKSQGESTPKGFFHILNEKCDNIATQENLLSAHDDLEKKSDEFAALLDETEIEPDKVLAVYNEFHKLNEDHLKHEEDIMMPKVMEMMKKGEPLKKIMMEEILPLIADDEEFFLSHACVTLEKHNGGMPRARVFVHALWAASTPEQWSKRKEIVKGALTKPTWKEIEGIIQVKD